MTLEDIGVKVMKEVNGKKKKKNKKMTRRKNNGALERKIRRKNVKEE